MIKLRPNLLPNPLLFLLLMLLLLTVPALAEDAHDDTADRVSFRNDIAPILAAQCQGCHNARDVSGDYRLDTFAHLSEPLGDFPTLTPGEPDDSELYLIITDSDDDFRMPPDSDPLPDEQIELIRRWIEQGAEYDADDPDAPLMRIIPAPTHPPAPATYPTPPPITALAFSPDGSKIAAGGYHEVTVWDVETGDLLRRIGNAPRRIHGLAWREEGDLLAVAGGAPGESGEVRLFHAADGELLGVPLRIDEVVLAIDLSPDGRSLATGAADQIIRILDLETGQALAELAEHSNWVTSVRYDAGGEYLASASRDQTAKAYDLETGLSLTTWREHESQVFDIGFRENAEHAVTIGADGRLSVWSVQEGDHAGSIEPASEPLQRLVTHGEHVFTAGADGRVRLHRIDNREHVRTYEGQADWLFAIAFHPGTGHLAAAGYDGHVTIWQKDEESPTLHFLAAPQDE